MITANDVFCVILSIIILILIYKFFEYREKYYGITEILNKEQRVYEKSGIKEELENEKETLENLLKENTDNVQLKEIEHKIKQIDDILSILVD